MSDIRKMDYVEEEDMVKEIEKEKQLNSIPTMEKEEVK
jgi:hypothetical protein